VDDLVRQYATEWGLKRRRPTGYLCGHRTWWKIAAEFCSAGLAERSMFEEVYFQPPKKIERKYFAAN